MPPQAWQHMLLPILSTLDQMGVRRYFLPLMNDLTMSQLNKFVSQGPQKFLSVSHKRLS